MHQAIIKKGRVVSEEIPAPMVSEGAVLIRVINSCISAGTEMGGVQSSRKSIVKRAIEQPDKIKKVLSMVKEVGPIKAYQTVTGKLESGIPSGYSVAGLVINTGEGVTGFEVGDHVAAAGAGLANHAEFVNVPVNLVAKIPKDMKFPDASTVTLGSIAMQGVRRADLSIGEFGVVYGTGVLGLLAVQMLRLSGVRVIAVDLDRERLKLAEQFGAEISINANDTDTVRTVLNCTGGRGADAVLFTAATKQNEPLSQSFKMCRKKGRVILIGVAGMSINRDDMYQKELDLLISTSYGPGRYDVEYEDKGVDYPYAYVRWTEKRNMEEYLRLVHDGQIKLEKLINAVYPIDKVTEAFESLGAAENRSVLVCLDYGRPETDKLTDLAYHSRKVIVGATLVKKDVINVALIGAGGFANAMHLPNIQKLSSKFSLYCVMSRNGHRAKSYVRQYGGSFATTDYNDVLGDDNVDLVLICTRHDSHAALTLRALESGKNVFVEKPLAINQKGLDDIKKFYDRDGKNKPILMVGYNRRFSRYAVEIKKHTDKRINPLFIRYRMNAGHIPSDHWVFEQGGRIIGESCHIIDLMSYFAGTEIIGVNSAALNPNNENFNADDNMVITLEYKDGSVCTIDYFSVGNDKFPKEYMEIHFDGKTIVLDDYKSLKGYGLKIDEISTSTARKGQLEELECLYKVLSGKQKDWPIELWDMIQTTAVTFMIQ